MNAQTKTCRDCSGPLSKDEIALNKKLMAPDVQEFQCLKCMSESFDCSISDLQIKIDEFKEQGCTLFI